MSSPRELDQAEAFMRMRGFIGRVATGPEMSKDLSREEAREALRIVLSGKADPVQIGILLIALRMKRETDAENLGVLDALLEATRTATAQAEEVVTLTDPFNGYLRCLPVAPFLPAVLAAAGVPTVSQGLESVAPKLGITAHRVYRAAGVAVDAGPEEAAARVSDPQVGWAYVDQSRYAPALHDLVGLRSLMVKRSVLTTAEVIPPAVCGARASHLVTGYVHKPYPRIYAMLAHAAGYASTLLVRGVEGGVIPSLRQPATLYAYRDGGELQPVDTDPAEVGIEQPVRAVPLPEEVVGRDEAETVDLDGAARAAAEAGLAALHGRPGASRDSLIYGASLILRQLGRCEGLPEAAEVVRRVLDNGEALARLRA